MPRVSKADQVFGEIARKNKLLTKAQVEECLKALETERGAKTLADVVEKRGLLSARAVKSISRALDFREKRLDSKLYARIAVKSKFAEVKEVRQALEAQKKAYLKGEATPDVGELLVTQGAVTSDEDKAIRETLRKLDKEALIGKLDGGGGGDGDGDGEDDGLDDAAAEAAVEEAPPAKKPSGRAAKGKRTPARGGETPPRTPPAEGSGRAGDTTKGGAAGSGRRSGREKPAVMVDDEILKGSEEEPTADGDDDDRPLPVDTQAFKLDEVDLEILKESAGAEAAKVATGATGLESSSSISDSSSGRSEPEQVEELKADLDEIDVKPRPPGMTETDDLMDVVMAPADLAPLGDEPPATEGEGEGEEKPAEGAAAAPPAKKRPESGEKGSVIEVPKLAAGAGQASECPRCNVRIEPHVMECLYCGYKVPDGRSESKRAAETADEAPAPKTSGRAKAEKDAKAAPAAKGAGAGAGAAKAAAAAKAAPAKAEAATTPASGTKAVDAGKGAGDLGKALAGELKEVSRVSGGVRFEVVRAKDAKRGGAACIALVLPAGIEPTDEQVAAFEADAEKVKDLDLKQLLHVERVVKTGGRTVIVYEDAEGTPALERVKAGPLDRMRASRSTRELAAALAEAQKAGLSVRELRPEAIFLTEGDTPSPRVAGYGAARLSEPPAQGGLAESGFDGFTPPERTKKPDAANARTDLFGVGAYLKLLLSGNAPTGKEPKADLPDAPGGLKTVLIKTLDPASGKRFLDFGKLLEELEKAPGVKGTTVELKR